MPTIEAWQHIYSNVEKEQSPQGRGGFQTLLYTQEALTQAEVEEMEGRLLYFPGKVTSPVKRLFFTITGGKGVVAQIVPLSSTDKYGRGGRYLAHGLVFAPEILAQIEANPFVVLRNFTFITTVEAALDAGDFDRGHISSITLNLSQSTMGDIEAAQAWAIPELKKLSLLALRAERQAREQDALTITGPPEQVEAVVEAAFLGVPRAIRPQCTFDSYFYRCNLVATYYWAVGLPEPPVTIKFAQVDAVTRQVEGIVDFQPYNSYEHWLCHCLDRGLLPDVARNRNTAFVLANWLDGQGEADRSLDQAAPELIRAVFKSNPAAVKAALRQRIAATVPDDLADRATAQIFRQPDYLALFQQLRQGFRQSELLDALYASYGTENYKDPGRREKKALKSLLHETDHVQMRLMWAYWDNPGKTLAAELERADASDYRQFGETALALNLLPALNLLRPGRGEAFLDLYLAADAASFEAGSFPALAQALIEAGEIACLPRLTKYLPKLSRRDLEKLQKLIEDQPDTPAEFRAALERAIAKLPAEGGIKGALKAVWRRLPGR